MRRAKNGVYTQYINRTHARVGHVFQGRYKAIVVEKDHYLLEFARYVVPNPVRAGIVEEPGAWMWSSYRATIGEAAPLSWRNTHWTLNQFAKQRRRAIARYIEFVRAGIGSPSVWEGLSKQIYLGSERFVRRMQTRAVKQDDLSEIPGAQRRPRAKGNVTRLSPK